MNPYIILAVVVAFVANGFYWDYSGHHSADTAWTAKVEKEHADSLLAAQQQEQKWQGVVNETTKKYETKVASISSNLDAALTELRQRPERASMSEATRVGCEGGTGAELSRPDAEFLDREAARADTIRAALAACYQVIDGTN
jgi:hypothetical protein